MVEFLIERGAKVDIQDDGKKDQAGDREYGGRDGRGGKKKRREWEIRHERER